MGEGEGNTAHWEEAEALYLRCRSVAAHREGGTQSIAQALADAEQRGAARVLAAHAAAGAPLRDDERAELDRLRAFAASTMGRHAYTPWLLSRGEHPDQMRHRPPGTAR